MAQLSKNLVPERDRGSTLISGLSLAWELGYTIAIPLVVFALAGRFLDRKLGSGPWLFLIGMLLSIVVSAWAIGSKAKKIIAASADEAKQ